MPTWWTRRCSSARSGWPSRWMNNFTTTSPSDSCTQRMTLNLSAGGETWKRCWKNVGRNWWTKLLEKMLVKKFWMIGWTGNLLLFLFWCLAICSCPGHLGKQSPGTCRNSQFLSTSSTSDMASWTVCVRTFLLRSSHAFILPWPGWTLILDEWTGLCKATLGTKDNWWTKRYSFLNSCYLSSQFRSLLPKPECYCRHSTLKSACDKSIGFDIGLRKSNACHACHGH